jgi:NAD(P)-dependent dehydrogenase (short-subunit alcohol dehydrogenase family)
VITGSSSGIGLELAKLAANDGYKGIRVNNFSPGVTDTPMLDSQHATKEESDAMRAMYIKMTPMGRLGRAEEMAASIFFLASDESSFTAGIDRAADGGLSEF